MEAKRLSAVEQLEASKPYYVKSYMVRSRKQPFTIRNGNVHISGSSPSLMPREVDSWNTFKSDPHLELVLNRNQDGSNTAFQHSMAADCQPPSSLVKSETGSKSAENISTQCTTHVSVNLPSCAKPSPARPPTQEQSSCKSQFRCERSVTCDNIFAGNGAVHMVTAVPSVLAQTRPIRERSRSAVGMHNSNNSNEQLTQNMSGSYYHSRSRSTPVMPNTEVGHLYSAAPVGCNCPATKRQGAHPCSACQPINSCSDLTESLRLLISNCECGEESGHHGSFKPQPRFQLYRYPVVAKSKSLLSPTQGELSHSTEALFPQATSKLCNGSHISLKRSHKPYENEDSNARMWFSTTKSFPSIVDHKLDTDLVFQVQPRFTSVCNIQLTNDSEHQTDYGQSPCKSQPLPKPDLIQHLNHADQFFDNAGMTPSELQCALATESATEEAVFFDSATSADSNVCPQAKHTELCAHEHGVAVVNNTVRRGTSIVERNARVIKWLWSIKKAR